MQPVKGLHHVTAVAGDPQANLNFYSQVLGQRLVKKTVNFDDPGTYHFYYADATGTPGSVLTFFLWKHMKRGSRGAGETGATAYSVLPDSSDYWRERLGAEGLTSTSSERFGEQVISFRDPEDMVVELITDPDAPALEPWANSPVPANRALRGFHSATLLLTQAEPTAEVLTLLGYREYASESTPEGERVRFAASSKTAGYLDVLVRPDLTRGQFGAGSVHHVAFRTEDDKEQLEYLSLLRAEGYNVTPVQDRQYFHSIYFREPGGVLFEIATDAPGFLYDEARDELGKHLKLPDWLEPRRADIEARVQPVVNPEYGEVSA